MYITQTVLLTNIATHVSEMGGRLLHLHVIEIHA